MPDGFKVKKKVCRLNQWIVTTVNNDLPNIVKLMEEEEYLDVLRKEVCEHCGKIAIATSLGGNMDNL